MITDFLGCELAPAGDARAPDPDELLALLEILRPKPCPRPLIRLGGARDGAYLLPDDLDGIAGCVSPGASTIKAFEDDLADRYRIPSYICDGSADESGFRTPMRRGLQSFEKLWLDVGGGEDTISLGEIVATRFAGTSGDLILQMDIEGAEYRNLLAADRDTLRRFRIICLELHRLPKLTDPAVFRSVLEPVFGRLDADFVSVHAHPNNAAVAVPVRGTGVECPAILEVTFLRRDRFGEDRSRDHPVTLPHPLDIPFNTVARPPLVLGDFWRGRARTLEERLRVAEMELEHTRARLHAIEQRSPLASPLVARSLRTLYLGKLTCADLEDVDLSRHEDVALGRPFVLTSSVAPTASRGRVERQAPFFFQTATEREPAITIDLGETRVIDWLVIENRTDGFEARARDLFFSLHESPSSADAPVYPVMIPHLFLTGAGAPSVTPVFGRRARHVTVASPHTTALHLSSISVYSPREAGS